MPPKSLLDPHKKLFSPCKEKNDFTITVNMCFVSRLAYEKKKTNNVVLGEFYNIDGNPTTKTPLKRIRPISGV